MNFTKNQKNIFLNKKVLVTGGTGSFGSTLVNHLLRTKVKEIIIFSRDEKKQEELRLKLRNDKIRFILGDVRDSKSTYLASKNVDYIFHAAALKQVPVCEFFPSEAYKTNVLGTENIINSAIENQVKKVLLLSTDKAVYPVNAMGLSKSMAEKILISRARELIVHKNQKTILAITRYGNVMGSRGSVIPVFIDQLLNNEPLTVTNINMTRFLLSLDDTINLSFYAFNHAKNGEIFIQKSPSTSLQNLILALSEIFNKKPSIKTIGIRHSEKLHETIVSNEEMGNSFSNKDFIIIKSDNRTLNYSNEQKLTKQGYTKDFISYSSNEVEILSVKKVIKILMNLDFIKEKLNNV